MKNRIIAIAIVSSLLFAEMFPCAFSEQLQEEAYAPAVGTVISENEVSKISSEESEAPAVQEISEVTEEFESEDIVESDEDNKPVETEEDVLEDEPESEEETEVYIEEAVEEEIEPTIWFTRLPEEKRYVYTKGEEAEELTVEAAANFEDEIEYTWYFAIADDDGVFRGNRSRIENANYNHFRPNTDDVREYYVFAEASVRDESGATACAESDIIQIIVEEPSEEIQISVQDEDGNDLISFDYAVSEYSIEDIIAEDDTCEVIIESNKKVWILSANSCGVQEAEEGVVELHEGINTITIGTEDRVYTIEACVLPTIKDISLIRNNENVEIVDENGSGFDPAVLSYTAEIENAAEEVSLEIIPSDEDYTVNYAGMEDGVITLAEGEELEITVSANDVSNTYVITANTAGETVYFNILPDEAKDAAITVTSSSGNVIEPNADGSYTAPFSAEEYRFVIRKYGYSVLSGIVPAEGGEVTIELRPNSEGTFEEVEAEWSGFRGSSDNMAITEKETPTDADTTELLWGVKLGDGWSNAPSVQIIVDNALIVMCANQKLYKLDLQTGDILAEADMVEAPNWGYTPPSYASGVIVCPLANGTIQAFEAKNLRSIWVYRDPKGGQSISPITISDGYVYTGFWSSYTKTANYVCLSLWDDRTKEEGESGVTGEKEATWITQNKGGYYWAGSLAAGDYIIVGGDDGSNKAGGDSAIRCFNKRTGELIDTLVLPSLGDQRSAIAYSGGKIYFTTKEGYICSACFDEGSGKLSKLVYKRSVVGAESTSTPVVYNGKVYFGVGAGYTGGEQQNFVAADAETLDICFKVNLRGNPQCSMLLSTAYKDSGWLYFYSTYNTKPGGITLIKVKTDAVSAADTELIELYEAEGYEEYCITSLICGKDGTLYYKNDSGAVLAVGTSGSKRVEAMIRAIGNVSAETIQENDRAAKAARAAFEALNSAEKAKVSNIALLENAEAMIRKIRMDEYKRLLEQIPEEITKDNLPEVRKIVEATRAAYEALNEEQKREVGIPERLIKAEEIIADFDVKQCERFIEQIPENIDENNESVVSLMIRKARAAYDQLGDDEKRRVANYEKLSKAEEQLAAYHVKKCIEMIDSIPEKTTKENKEEAQRLVNQARSYYESLTDEEKKQVTNSGMIAKKQREINLIDAEGRTHSIKDGEGGYTISEATADVIEMIDQITINEDPRLLTDDEVRAVIAAAAAYDALNDDEKLFVANYEKLEGMLNIVSMANHRDKESGILIMSEKLPWNVQLIAGKTETEGELADTMNLFLNGSGTIGNVYYLRLWDILMHEAVQPEEPISLYIPCDADAIERMLIVPFFDAEGDLSLLTGEFAWVDPMNYEVYIPEENADPEIEQAVITREEAEKKGYIACVYTEIAETDAWYGTIDIEERWESLMDGIDVLNFDVLPENWGEYLYIPDLSIKVKDYC